MILLYEREDQRTFHQIQHKNSRKYALEIVIASYSNCLSLQLILYLNLFPIFLILANTHIGNFKTNLIVLYDVPVSSWDQSHKRHSLILQKSASHNTQIFFFLRFPMFNSEPNHMLAKKKCYKSNFKCCDGHLVK